MMRMRKTGCILVAAVLAFSVSLFGGCSRLHGQEETRQIDPFKTQLNISNNDAGIGREWIEETADLFEEAFKDYSFEPGKTGVQVWMDHNRSEQGTDAFNKIASSANHIFFGEGYDYLALANGAKLLDVTDVYMEKAVLGYDAENDTLVYEENRGTIYDKLNEDFQGFLNLGSETEKKLYAMPFYLAPKTPIYNKDLWNDARLYFSKSSTVSTPSEYVAQVLNKAGGYTEAELQAAKEQYKTAVKSVTTSGMGIGMVDESGKNKDGQEIGRSAGPDAKYGTDDDGLPATYDEFYLLCDYMAVNNITPIIWSGKNPQYADMFTLNLWRNYEGYAQMYNYYNLTGTLDNIVKIEGDKIVRDANGDPVTESVEITNGGRDNGYVGARQLGKYYALEFAEKIATTPDWTATDCWNQTSHTEAQAHYITYGVTATGQQRIGILIDGAWWQQEANSTFELMARGSDGKYTKDNMRFGILRLPDATIDKYVQRHEGAKDIAIHTNYSFVFAKGNIPEGTGTYNATKMFMSFIHSDEMMRLFSENTNILRGLNADYLDDDAKSKLSPFGRDLIEYIEDCDIVFPYSANDFINDNFSEFDDDMEKRNFKTYGSAFGENYQAINMLHDSTKRDKGLNAETWFVGMNEWYRDHVWPGLKK